MTDCPGLITSETTGEPVCPHDGFPPEWQTWDDYCAECRRNQERWLELQVDCESDDRAAHEAIENAGALR